MRSTCQVVLGVMRPNAPVSFGTRSSLNGSRTRAAGCTRVPTKIGGWNGAIIQRPTLCGRPEQLHKRGVVGEGAYLSPPTAHKE